MRCGSNNRCNRPSSGISRAEVRRRAGGFTFAEVLAAMVFLGVLIPVVVEGLALANRAALVAERQSVAAQLAGNLLNNLVVSQTWDSGQASGDFGEDWPGYSWQLLTGSWTEDTMTQLTVVVSYQVQGRDYEVSLTTLVDDTETTE